MGSPWPERPAAEGRQERETRPESVPGRHRSAGVLQRSFALIVTDSAGTVTCVALVMAPGWRRGPHSHTDEDAPIFRFGSGRGGVTD
jgi:mannose-6-phosphate isomerase-like protein (cupin superfamily)